MEESAFSLFKKSFPFLISAGTGISWKLYDDLVDRYHYDESSAPVEFSKVAVVLFTTLLLLQLPFIVNLFFIMLVFFTYVAGEIDTLFWKSATIIPIFTTLFALQNVSSYDSTVEFNGGLFLYFIVAGLYIYIESKLYPEEISTNKTLFRVLCIIIGLIISYITFSHPQHHSISFLVFLPIAYLLVSVSMPFFLPLPSNAISAEGLSKV